MDEKILEKIRNDLENRTKQKEKYNELCKRKNELENNSYIKEYKELSKEIEKIEKDKEFSLTDKDIISMYSLYLCESGDKEKVKVYVYIGTYKILDNERVQRIDFDDENADYRLYLDVERLDFGLEKVEIDKCAEFEKINSVIFSDLHFSLEYIQEIRNKFISYSISTSPKQAKDKILEEYNSR